MKKILLVRPPSSYGENLRGFQLDLPLGILYIAGVLEKNGYQVEVFDARVDFADHKLLNTYANKEFVEKHWITELKKVIQHKNPDVVGITNQFSAQIFNAVRVAEVVKSANKNILTIVGGPHASVCPESFLKLSNAIDIVVMREGEYVILDIIDAYNGKKSLQKIKGITYRSMDGKIINNGIREPISNLDDLPYPAYHLIRLEKYFKAQELGFEIRGRYNYPGSERCIPMITSRGCPYNCIFCSVHLHMGRKWRPHSAKYVLNYIKFVTEEYDVKHIHFEDDTINIDIKRFEKIVDGIIHLNSGITWDTPNGLRADGLSLEILKKIKKSKCTYLIIGVESGNQGVLDKIIHKRLDLKKVIQCAQWCQDLGIDLRAFYVFGFPGETIDNIKQTIDFTLEMLEKYGVYPYIHIAMPYVGTKLYQICKEKNYLQVSLENENYRSLISGTSLIGTESFSILDLERLHTEFHRQLRSLTLHNYLKLAEKNKLFLAEVLSDTKLRYECVEDKIREIVEYQNCKQRADLIKK
ncbi:MAG: radical SAM protein [Elusimicrobiota bacterium]